MPTVDITGRVAAVTGASSGIGEATALALAGAGCAVALAARRSDRIEALAKRINDDGGKAVAIATDVADEAQARAFVTQAHEQLGGLHVLVNNAGVMLLGPFEGQTGDDWRRMIEVNCLGLLYCTQAALPLMRDGGGGHVVNVSSTAGRVANAFTAVYNMTKFGVTAYSEALRQEALHSKIRVTCVEPGFVETELLDHNPDFVQGAAAERKEKIGQVLRAEDIADAIVNAVAQPVHVAINEILIRPAGQP
jgi:NADP-dependent 3-hydroxy acid dehydrogenase YdfG